MKDLVLKSTYCSFRSIIKREHTKQKKRSYFRKANLDRQMRRQKLDRERRERELLKRKGGHSYKSSSFGSETFSEPIIKRPSRTRRPRTRRITTTSTTKMTTARGKGVKRRNDDHTQLSISSPSNSSSNTEDSSGDSSDIVCDISDQRQSPTIIHRSISRWSKLNWIGCGRCTRWFHQCCTEISKNTDISSLDFTCCFCE